MRVLAARTVSPTSGTSSTSGRAPSGGAGLVFTEATAVTAEGRISPEDLGIWSDRHIEPLARCVRFIHAAGPPGGHPARPRGTEGQHETSRGSRLARCLRRRVAGRRSARPTLPFADGYPIPHALDEAGIAEVVTAFADAANRALEAGFDVVEIHAAHGYLIHEFLSPLSNTRTDAYGGGFDNRARLCLEVVDAVRAVWPERQPVFVRISATDWTAGGWDIEQSVELARRLRDRGVDLIDCSSGGNVATASIPVGPGYQVPFAEQIRREAGIATGAVGLITEPAAG